MKAEQIVLEIKDKEVKMFVPDGEGELSLVLETSLKAFAESIYDACWGEPDLLHIIADGLYDIRGRT